jgi:hypothetical protein
MGTQIDMSIRNDSNLINSINFHNRFHHFFEGLDTMHNVNTDNYDYNIPILMDSSGNINNTDTNINNTDTNNTDTDIITNSIDILTNLISSLINNDNVENIIDNIIDNISVSTLQELQEHLLDISNENNAELRSSRNNYANLLREYNNLQLRAVNLQTRLDAVDQQMTDLQEALQPDEVCCICDEHPRTFVNTTCGHMCACQNCTLRLDRCPICRAEGTFIRVIRS